MGGQDSARIDSDFVDNGVQFTNLRSSDLQSSVLLSSDLLRSLPQRTNFDLTNGKEIQNNKRRGLSVLSERLNTKRGWFSNDNTYIANASPWEIRANVNIDRRYTKKLTVGVTGKVSAKLASGQLGVNVGADYVWDIINKDGFTRILPRKAMPFHVTGDPSVFVTIIAVKPDGLEVFVDDLPVDSDRSLIVQRSGHVALAKYGTIWQPEN